jgi:undecaprenyl-diphosphatase
MTDLAIRGKAGTQTSDRVLARQPVIGLAMFVVGAIAFLALMWDVKNNGPLAAWDLAVVNQFHAWATHSSPFVKWLMVTGSFIGQDGIIFGGLAIGLIWIFRRKWHYVLMLVLGPAVCEGLYQILGGLIGRHRPVFPDAIEVLKGPGFPSGHTSVGLAFFGLLAYLLWPHLTKPWQRILVVTVVVLLLAYITISRLFQGVHYPTDLLAGFALGLAWSGIVYTLLERTGRKTAR